MGDGGTEPPPVGQLENKYLNEKNLFMRFRFFKSAIFCCRFLLSDRDKPRAINAFSHKLQFSTLYMVKKT